MALPKPDAINTLTTEEASATTSQSDAVDYVRLNDLLLSVTEKLTTDSFGNFSIRGSQTVKDGRQTQLREVFELKTLLEANKALMERKASVSSGETVIEGKRGGKFTSAQLAAIRSVVQQEQQAFNPAAQSRAIKDRLDTAETRMHTYEARLRKAETENGVLREKVSTLESNTESLMISAARIEMLYDLRTATSDLETRMQRTEERVKDQAGVIEFRAIASARSDRMDAYVKATDKGLAASKQAMSSMHEQIQEQLTRLSQDMEVLRDRLDQAAAHDESGIAVNGGGHDQLSPDIAAVQQDLDKRVVGMKERILEIEERQEQHSADYANFVDGVDGLESRANGYARREVNRVSTRVGQLTQDLVRADESVKGLRATYDRVQAWGTNLSNDHKQDIARLDGDVARIDEDVAGVRGDVASIDRDVDRINRDVVRVRKDHESLRKWSEETGRWYKEVVIPGVKTIAGRVQLTWDWSPRRWNF